MSSQWKYANIDANQRLKMLREGNSELFDEEVERTRSITKARRELGLDTTEQENWMDTIGYNYNVWNAKMAGESPDNVSKTGYAELYLNGHREKRANAFAAQDRELSKLKSARNAASSALEESYANAKAELDKQFEHQYSVFEEAIINSGASLDGGKANRLRDSLESEYSKIYDELEKNKSTQLEKLKEKYDGYEEKLRSYAKSGAKATALSGVTNAIINEAARIDGYNAAEILNKSSNANNAVYTSESTTDAEKQKPLKVQTKKPETSTKLPNMQQLSALSEKEQKLVLTSLGYSNEAAERICSYINSHKFTI